MKVPILYVQEKEIHFWTIKDILEHINDSRSNEWTPYNETDWKEGWKEWVEHEGNYKLYPQKDVPKVQLKKVVIQPSTDGYYINADMWIDGVKCYNCLDLGNGGEMEFTPYTDKRVRNLIAKLNLFIEMLPEKEIDFGGENVQRLTMDLPLFFENCLGEWEIEQARKKALKKQNTHIIMGEGNKIFTLPIPKKLSVTKIMEYSNGKTVLQNYIDSVIDNHCTGNDKVILNKNLKKHGIVF